MQGSSGDLPSPVRNLVVHFTPTSDSWLNLVERWFSELTTKKLNRGADTSVRSTGRVTSVGPRRMTAPGLTDATNTNSRKEQVRYPDGPLRSNGIRSSRERGKTTRWPSRTSRPWSPGSTTRIWPTRAGAPGSRGSLERGPLQRRQLLKPHNPMSTGQAGASSAGRCSWAAVTSRNIPELFHSHHPMHVSD